MLKLNWREVDLGCSYHNHSNWSDGASDMAEMCRSAKAAGFREFGLADHWVVPPHEGMDSESWSMGLDRLDDYVAALMQLRNELDDENFFLKIGLEVDFFYENIDDVLKNLQAYPLDYLVGSVHYAGIFSVDNIIDDWYGLSEEHKAEICDIYYQKLAGAASCPAFDFIGHLDLPKKFGMINNREYFPRAIGVLDIIARHRGAIEVNTSGWYKECAEQYPAAELLQEACQRQIPVVVNADAHCADHIRRGFSRAGEVLQAVGYQVKY